MEAWVGTAVGTAMGWLALPQHGLGALFLVSLLSATLLPGGSEPALLALCALTPSIWPSALGVATLGNTLGGVVTYGMAWGARRAMARARSGAKADLASPDGTEQDTRASRWLQRFGPKACVLAWLPGVGDALCAAAGWLRLPFWPCVAWMALGKLARYAVAIALLQAVWSGGPTA
jgi:membrane protein YqaA with SNARE-associated domain